MATGPSGSPIANQVARKSSLAKVRTALLDGPGTKRRGGPPPPTAPADRPNPREQTLAQQRNLQSSAADQPPASTEPGSDERPAALFDDETRGRLLEQAKPFLADMQSKKRAQLHKRVGRIRRFWGRGL